MHNWSLEEFRTVIAWRTRQSAEDVRFYGEQYELHRAALRAGTPGDPPHPVLVPEPSHDEAKGYRRCPHLPETRGGPLVGDFELIQWD